MKYQQLLPPSHLQQHVQYYWTLENACVLKTFKTIVDGCPGMIFQKAETYNFYQNDKPISSLFIFGQATRFAEISMGRSVTIGVCFFPHALRSVFGLNAHELTDTCIDLNDVSTTRAQDLKEQLLNTDSIHEQIDLLSAYIYTQVQKHNQQADNLTNYVWEFMTKANGNVSLKALQQHLQVSERNLERRFKKSIGISPKLFARICSFQAAVGQMCSNNYQNLSDVAYTHGYADQSHFIRTFKAFSGLSPYQYKNKAIKVANHFPEVE
jgi:AraC-like DNA-binding protein